MCNGMRLPLARLLDAGLFENPALNLGVPHAQQIQRPAAVMLLGQGGRLVPHDLRAYAGRTFDPLGQSAEGTAQAMQGEGGEAGGGQRLVVRNARLLQPSRLGAGAAENPLVPAG